MRHHSKGKIRQGTVIQKIVIEYFLCKQCHAFHGLGSQSADNQEERIRHILQKKLMNGGCIGNWRDVI
jgi:hypothetical protein